MHGTEERDGVKQPADDAGLQTLMVCLVLGEVCGFGHPTSILHLFIQLALVLPHSLWEEAAHVNYNPYENAEEPDKIGGVAYFKYTLGVNEKASFIFYPFQIWTCTETHTCFQCNYSQSELDLAIAP